jgi:hypothetical protein
MSITSRLRWPASLAAGAAAAAVLALAVPAAASTGTAQISPEQAGYTDTGAQFKSITAAVYLRNPTQYASEVASFGDSVQLWSAGLVAVVGVTASTFGSGYIPYAKIYDRSTHQLLASNPNAFWCDPWDNCLLRPRFARVEPWVQAGKYVSAVGGAPGSPSRLQSRLCTASVAFAPIS